MMVIPKTTSSGWNIPCWTFTDFTILALFVWLFVLHLNVITLGYWCLAIHVPVMVATVLLADRVRILNVWRRIDDFCSSAKSDQSGDGQDEWWWRLVATDHGEQTVCLRCGEPMCHRHGPEFVIHREPWKNLLVDERINDKLVQLMEMVLTRYTESWLPEICYDRTVLLQHIKHLIRTVVAGLALRATKRIRLDDFIVDDIPSHLVQHLEMYVHGKRRARTAHFLEESVLRQYHHLMHPAVMDAQHQHRYYKTLAELVVLTTMPPSETRCPVARSFLVQFISGCLITPLVDMLTDPDKINIILIYLLGEDNRMAIGNPATMASGMPSPNNKIPLLSGFGLTFGSDGNQHPGRNVFGIPLDKLLDDPNLLFLFTRFAKERCFLHHLQFVIHMRSFLNRLIKPDLTGEESKELHAFLNRIYRLYFREDSTEFIDFDESIRTGFWHAAMESDFRTVQHFRNCKSLYEACKYVTAIVEWQAQRFFQTDVYLKLVCGQRARSVDGEDGKATSTSSTGNSDLATPKVMQPEEEEETFDHQSSNYDLSDWTVSVPVVRIDDGINHETPETTTYFQIHVTDSTGNRWSVERQYGDFYILEAKLKEFHGDELADISLPRPRSSLIRTDQMVMVAAADEHRDEFERFLRLLLSNGSMKRSKLFYNFLNADIHSSAYQLWSSTNNLFNLSKMIRNVPSRFSKEKGQHLCSFIRNFIAASYAEKEDGMANGESALPPVDSTALGGGRPKHKKSLARWPELDLFEPEDQPAEMANTNCVRCEYLYDYIVVLLVRFYRVTERVWQLFCLWRPIFGGPFQRWCHRSARRKLRQTFRPEAALRMLDALLAQLDDETGAEDRQTTSTKNQRSERALALVRETLVPRWMAELLLPDYERHEQAVYLAFSALQHRLLNKQLLFLLTDRLMSRLYPAEVLAAVAAAIDVDGDDHQHHHHYDC